MLFTLLSQPRLQAVCEAAEQLTSLRPAMKVLYMSGYPNDGIVQSGTLATRVAFLEKPFTREILLRKVRQVLDEMPSRINTAHTAQIHTGYL
jgi:two-component system, cell cycle sensor histidine kinase and response regulator CckA